MRITNNERMPKILGKFKLSLILALVVILPISTIFGAVLNAKYSVPMQIQPGQVLDTFNKTIFDTFKDGLQQGVAERDSLNRDVMTEDEQELLKYYQSDQFLNQFADYLALGNYFDVLDLMMSGINDYLQEYNDREDSNLTRGLSRDWFAGVERSQQACVALYKDVNGHVLKEFGYIFAIAEFIEMATQIWGILMMSPVAGYVVMGVEKILSILYIVFGSIPIVGWIALAILAGIALVVQISIFVAMYVNGSNNKGFRVGVDVLTGWFGIPYWCIWVCE